MMTRILGTVFAGLIGLAFGSFLNVCLSRWPAAESVVAPRSHCRECGRTLTWWENVPLISWLALRGRCRTCGVWIGWRYPIVELAVGALWACAAWRFGQNAFSVSGDPFIYADVTVLIGSALVLWLLVALAVLDAEHLWLPDVATIPATFIGIAYSALVEQFTLHFDTPHKPLQVALWRTICAALAAGLVLLIRWVYWLVRRREGIGLGDAKLMAMLGAWFGLSAAFLAFGIGVVLGALVALVLLAVKPKQDQAWSLTRLPLGTFLCIGGIISGLWGQRIIDAYLRWAGF